jgi:hypothetical protein
VFPEIMPSGLTVCIVDSGADVDNVWEQKKLEARKMLENAAESPASSAPRKSGTHFSRQKPLIDFAKYTPKRQNNKPYKAVEACRRSIPEVHHGYRSN